MDTVNEQLNLLETIMRPKAAMWKCKERDVNMGLKLLDLVLTKGYGSLMENLILLSEKAGEGIRFSGIALETVKILNWSKSTISKAQKVIKHILNETDVADGFASMVRILIPKKPIDPILGKDTFNFCEKKILEQWITKIKDMSHAQSSLSIRNMITFYRIQCLPHLNIDLNEWPVKNIIHIEDDVLLAIMGTTSPSQTKKKFGWLQFFITNILESPFLIPNKFKKSMKIADRTQEDEMDYNGEDHHRISSMDLDKIYEESKENIRSELFYLIMITTGIRIGGLSKILLKGVATINGAEYQIKNEGRTIEKRNKWVTFILSPRVKELIFLWLTTSRPAVQSEYLFPGASGGRITTQQIRNVFGRLCKSAGLSGNQFHPHSLRHSYAHLLLENGNTSQVVSKLLNHASSVTTETFYLKESAAQISARANIPWMKKEKKKQRIYQSF